MELDRVVAQLSAIGRDLRPRLHFDRLQLNLKRLAAELLGYHNDLIMLRGVDRSVKLDVERINQSILKTGK
jgi:hypothetical protein